MATASHHYLEEARPPEAQENRKYFDNNYRYYHKRSSVAKSRKLSIGALSLPAGLLTPEPEIEDSNVSGAHNNNININSDASQALRVDEENSNVDQPKNDNEAKNASTMSTSSQTNHLQLDNCEKRVKMAYGRRPVSLPATESTGMNPSTRKRTSYHQDAEEALSSLLWQPYEYRTDSSDTLSSLSTGSSSSTSLSLEASANANKNKGGLLQSFTDEFLNMTTSFVPGGAGAGIGNNVDPNLSTAQQQMVSNLMVLDAATVGCALSQYQWSIPSRGHDGASTLSQVESEHSRVRELARRSICNRYNNTVSGTVAYQQQYEYGVACGLVRECTSDFCDNVQVSGGDSMRVEIPGSGPQHPERVPDIAKSSTIVTSSNNAQRQHQHNVLFQCSSVSVGTGGDCVSIQTASPQIRQPTTRVVSNDMIPSNITSVVSANVVGLPVHSRSSSNLSSRGDTVPNHPRSVSDTANVLQVANHFRSNSNIAPPTDRNSLFSVSSTTHARNSSLSSAVQTRGTSEPINIITNTTTNRSIGVVTTASATDDSTHKQIDSRVPPLPNVSNVNVNFYRAVPVNVVSTVPTIQCLNSVEDTSNVSNVHIVQAMPTSQPPRTVQQEVRTRTFTSTEAQTDDTTVGAIVAPTVVPSVNREQRRRDRRERRHQRRLNSSNHQHQQPPPGQNDRLPDLLNSHLPPPYTTLPSGMPAPMVSPSMVVSANTMVASPTMVPFHPGVVAGQVPLVQGSPPVPVPAPPTSFRFPFPTAAGFRRCRSRLGPRYSTEEHQPKSCCGFLISRPGSLRWFIALIALVAVCCVLVGTVLGAMRPAGRDHLTVSLLMIGVGIVLVTVSGVAWRLTSHDAPSCRAMLGLESNDATDICTRRFVPRLPPSYGRPHHPYAAMIYPEFQYRPPPPSYQASMQEYRLRLLLLDRGATPQIQNAQHAVSPPPTYRSHAGSLLRAPLSNRRDATQSEYSCPPSYRSRTSSNRQPTNELTAHSREQSLSLSESNHDGSVVNVVNILANQEEEIALENMTLDSLKVAPENEIAPLRMLLKSSSGSDLETTTKDGNLVTIVQKADQNPVIVTVSGSQMSTTNPAVGSSNQISTEMEILAHL